MTRLARSAVYWAPRALSISFIVFLSLFALDVFQEGAGVWRTTLALLMHLIPSFVLVGALALAWRWEWIGAGLFGAAGTAYMAMAWRHPSWIAIISGPQFVIAALFLLGRLKRAEIHRRP
jgi:hypothetical protein